MADERVPRFGTRIEPQSINRARTPWDRVSIDSVINHFQPVLDKLRPIAVYLRLSEDSDADEPSIAASRRRGRKRLPALDVLDMVTFADANGGLEGELKLYETAETWSDKSARGGQSLRVRYYSVPYPTTLSKEPIDTLEKARAFFNINPENHEQIYPPISSETPKA